MLLTLPTLEIAVLVELLLLLLFVGVVISWWVRKRRQARKAKSGSIPAPLEEPELYDLFMSESKDDLAFWKNIAKEVGGPVLEVGARTGRVTMELARTGLLVTALEPSRARLQYARVQAEQKLDRRTRLEWVESKLYDFSLGSQRTFRLIVAPLGTLQELRNLEEIKQCLDCMVKHLEPEGRVVLAVQAPRPETLQLPRHHERVLHSTRTSHTVNYYVTQEANHLWEKLKTTHEYEIMESHPPRWVSHAVEGSYFSCRDLVNLLHDAGLETEKIFGSYASQPPDQKSDLLIFKARRLRVQAVVAPTPASDPAARLSGKQMPAALPAPALPTAQSSAVMPSLPAALPQAPSSPASSMPAIGESTQPSLPALPPPLALPAAPALPPSDSSAKAPLPGAQHPQTPHPGGRPRTGQPRKRISGGSAGGSK
jgi:2-polyprenyl-3-methyl-5-hydroxy-6-metoxy-1,4-benzoquinol methylase